MNVVNTIYSLEDVKNFSDDELYQRLFECWNITNGKIEVWGDLKSENTTGNNKSRCYECNFCQSAFSHLKSQQK
jgi:hypothetical protein